VSTTTITNYNSRKEDQMRVKPNATICECGLTAFAKTTWVWVTIVDTEDAGLLQKYKWNARGKGLDYAWYAYSPEYRRDTGNSDKLHQAVMKHAFPRGLDHINRWGMDNRKANLRPANDTQQFQNRRKQATAHFKEPTSRFKGVWKIPQTGKWRACITVNRQRIWLGYFGFETDAAIAYNYHAAHYFGEYASLNDLSDIKYEHD
jgi:hypothetical protein